MKTLKFKTNINCGNCVANAKPFLDKIKNIESWEVDTNDPDKVLTVKGHDLQAADVIDYVQKAGYKIEEKKGFLSGLFG